MNIIVNLWAVVACAVASMIIGSIWYGPLFGKMYMTAMGMDQWTPEKKAAMQKKMVWSYIGQFVASLVMFYILGTFIVWSAPQLNVSFAMGTSFFMWLGFVVPMAFGNTLWGGKMINFWLTIGNMLITLLVAGAIIGAWK
ncbi:MAG: DUF1761 domain-containing protein [Candidatus Doudnabacteria bacterium]|nr:DUF1761 domain-containing protein [Candidatus Doudnabacteria bacterium]